MATAYKNDNAVSQSYTVDILTGNSQVIEIAGNVSTVIIEAVFLAGTGSGIVYTSIDGIEKIRTMIDEEDETGITWTYWEMGTSGVVTESTTDKIATACAPLAVKFTNLGATTIRFNLRGIFGGI